MPRRAFTLVELLVVIAIIGLLSTIAIISTSGSREKARLAAAASFERSVYDAAADELLTQWDFEDCTGTGIAATSITDVSNFGNNGTPTGGPQWSSDTPTGKGCSLSLNGTGQYVTGARSIDTLASNSFTVSTWAKRLSLNRDDYYFSLGSVSVNHYLIIGFRAQNVFTCAFYGNDYNSPATYTDTNWHLWTCTYDASSSKRSLYRDGVLVGGDTSPSPFLGSGVPEIARYSSNGFLGSIDNVRIYSKALTAQAIQKYYAESRLTHPIASAEK
jgi:prepilin-type N-terminal cleavage/methylation domain-containing protein